MYITKEEVINIIKDKFSNENFKYPENSYGQDVLYKDQNISINITWRYVTLYFTTPINMSNIQINMVRHKITKERILTKFRKMLRLIDKVDEVLKTLNSKKEEITRKVNLIIKNDYNTEADKVIIKLNKSQKLIGRYRFRNVDYDVSIKDQKTYYEILASVHVGREKVSLTFKYIDSNLILLRRNESYQSKNISNIIRSEKLKSLFNE